MAKGIQTVKEDDIQKAIFQWAQYQYSKHPELKALYHVPNEGIRTYAQTAWLKSMGMKKGFPDICLPVPKKHYGALYIELKTKNGRVSDEQKEWIQLLKELGNMAVICRSYEEAISTIEVYLS